MIITTDESLGRSFWDWVAKQNKNQVLNDAKKDTEFITVTSRDNGKPTLINLNAIVSIHEDWSGETSTVWIEMTTGHSYGVLEDMNFFKEILT